MKTPSLAEFHYRLPWLSAGLRVGAHRSRQAGAGERFDRWASFLQFPDARRVDLRITARDPFGAIHVRVYRQRGAIAVYVLADLSASMGFGIKPRLLHELASSVAASVHRHGDSFGFVGGADPWRADLFLPATRRRGLPQELLRRLGEALPAGRGSAGLVTAAGHLPRRRALVFIASDFHFPRTDLQRVLAATARHDVVPVVIWQRAEYTDLPRFGLADAQDLETGERRLLLMRPALAAQLAAQFEARRRLLARTFAAYGREPFFLVDRFDAERLTEYFFRSS